MRIYQSRSQLSPNRESKRQSNRESVRNRGTLRIDQSPSQLPLNRESKRESNLRGTFNDGGTLVDPLLALTASIHREVESGVKSGVNLEVKSNSGGPSSEDSAELTFKL